MGSFVATVSYAMGINRCGYKIIHGREMGSFGNFLFFEGMGFTRMTRINTNWRKGRECGMGIEQEHTEVTEGKERTGTISNPDGSGNIGSSFAKASEDGHRTSTKIFF